MIRMLLRAIAATGAAATSIADDLIVEFWTHRRHFRLDGDDLPGALVLALNAPGREGSDDLLSDILKREEVLSDKDLGLALIGAGQRAIDADSERLAVIVATWLDKEPADTAAVLLRLPPDIEGQLLMDAESLLRQRLDARKARIAEGKDEAGNPQDDPAEVESLPLRDRGLAGAVAAALDAGRRPMATFLAIQLLASETAEAREIAADQLQRLAPITSEALILLVLNATAEQELASWPRWLGSIDAASLSGAHQDALAGLTRAAWTKAAEDEADG